MIENQ